jgi:ADP-ribose pyrophosphatase YjhB (NUDIX family)
MTETLVVVSSLIERGDKVLLVQETEKEIRGKWCFPGGKLEQGETLEKGAERELLEECGMRLMSMSIIRIYEGVRDNRLGLRIHLRVHGTEIEDHKLSDDVLRTGWFTRQELKEMYASDQIRGGKYHQQEIVDYLNGIPVNGSIVLLEP